MHIGRNISRLRSFRGIKQLDVAKRLKMTQQNYSLIENAEEVDDNLLSRIAAIIDFPVEMIKDLDNSKVQSIFNSGSITDSIFYQNNPVDKIIELYERLLKEKDETITILQKDKK
ncbi:transcriptional regulator [Flavipsychrobacter stenotrophus]|uniref:Transcriptional regulator n=1 Tax=Flavipsychrobacter stenotrophus TaxID=2077091 RepID=A0A2S7SS77_9BACT|nr:helix-turn-helix transcriptional regulator [Flavipsychrobacter stenotrophus]PQJ09760.1 transcriptional regulator [Flavipsychrobacter stenotrophus]